MTTKLFTNIDLTGNPLKALPNVYDNQAFALTTAQDKLIDLLTFVLVDHVNGPGWGKPFTGTNKAVFRPGVGNRHYFRVDETDNAYYADVRMYEGMTDVDTGGNEAPSGGTSRWYKGGSSGSNENDWIIVCDEQAFYYGVRPVDSSSFDGFFLSQFWGDLIEYDPASAYLTALYSSSNTGANIQVSASHPLTGRNTTDVSNGNFYLMRRYDNTGTSVPNVRQAPRYYGQSITYVTGGQGEVGAPNIASGDVELAKVDAFELASGSVWRAVAEIPGLHAPRHHYQDTYLVPQLLNYLPPSGDFSSGFLCVRSGSGGGTDTTPGPLVISLGDWR